MKKCIATLLVLVAILSMASFALADGTITFQIRVTSPFGSRTYTQEMRDTLTIGDLRSYISNLGRANLPGHSSDPLWWHYSAGQTYTIDVDSSDPEHKNYEVLPNMIILKDPHQTKKPSPKATAKPTNRKSSSSITWSTEYLYQIFANNRSFDFRVFGDGKKIAFKESFDMNADSKMTAELTVRGVYTELKPVYTEEAVKGLLALGVSEVRIISTGGEDVYDLQSLLDGSDG